MVDRIATFTQSQMLNSSNMRLQSEYAQKQNQLSSGQKSDSYAGIAAETPQILSLESDYSKLVSQSENVQTALDRTEMMYDILGNMVDIGQGLLDDLNAAISGTGVNDTQLVSLAEQGLEQIVSLLNTQSTGRYLFAGSDINNAPVNLDSYTGTSGITLPSTADASYYEGNDYIQSVEVRDGFNVEYGITADNEAFEEIIRALDLVINHESNANPTATLEEAYDLLNRALEDISSLRATVSQDSQVFDQAIDDGLTELNLIDTMIANLEEVDLAEVSVRLQELETQLEASYTITTKLLNLKLSDYL